MTISFYFRKIDKNSEKQIRDYFAREKIGRITRFLRHGNLDLANLRIAVEHFPHHNNFFS